MMSRTQVALEPEQQRRARRRAHDLGISFAEYIRQLVARDLGPLPRKKRVDVSFIFDLGRSEGSDIRNRKDEMIGAAVEAEWKRSLRR